MPEKAIEKILEAVKLHGLDRKAYSYLGMINVQTDLENGLLIFNYSKECAHKSDWNDVELICRGLIIDYNNGEPKVIGRAFDKFFNLEQAEETKIINLPPEDEIDSVTYKEDGCFREDTTLNLWGGGTITIGEVVRGKLSPTLVGRNEQGEIVPCEITGWFNNGHKDNWLEVTLSNPVSIQTGSGGYENKLRVTTNHNVFINGTWQPIGNAKVGDRVLTYETIPDKNIKHMIYSGLLGDGSLVKAQNSFRYQESHNTKTNYNKFINDWLGNSVVKWRQVKSGYGSDMVQVSTKTYKSFSSIRNDWYDKNGRKHLPSSLSWMDDFSVAKWYMDDGCLSTNPTQNDRAVFATHGFSKIDVERLSDKLNQMYGVNSIVCEDKRGKGFYIRVNYNSGTINKMWKAIAPYIIEDMRYKLPIEYRNVEFINYQIGKEITIPIKSDIIDIKILEVNKRNFPSGAVGFDIETTTHSYFAKGILVHNSMGFTYRNPKTGKVCVATRGSFNSEQAVWATEEFNNIMCRESGEKYNSKFFDNKSLIFEIIYPENRVVLDYKGAKKLILIGVRDLITGREYDYHEVVRVAQGFEMELEVATNTYSTSIQALLEDAKRIRGIEGWVIRYKNGLRVKLKTDEYIALHRLVSHLTPKHVKELLMQPNGKQLFIDFANGLPDEFTNEATDMFNKLYYQYTTIANYSLDLYDTLQQELGGMYVNGIDERVIRKTFAEKVNELFPHYRDIMFALFDEKDIAKLIWKRVDVNKLFTSPEKEFTD